MQQEQHCCPCVRRFRQIGGNRHDWIPRLLVGQGDDECLLLAFEQHAPGAGRTKASSTVKSFIAPPQFIG